MHDIKGASSMIGLVAESLRASEDPLIRKQVNRLDTCLDRIVDICDSHLGTNTNRETTQTLRCVLADVVELAESFSDEHTRLRFDTNLNLRLGVQAKCLFRILFNLTVNSVHAVNDAFGGEVVLRAFELEGIVFIEITDDGMGVSPTDGAIREEARSGRRKRYGIGMAIAETLTRSLGGALILGPSNRLGTTISFAIERRLLI